MEKINLELIAYKLDEISKKQELYQSDVSGKLDSLHDTIHIVKNLDKSIAEIKEWKEKRDRHVPIKDFIELSDWKKELDQLISPKQLDKMLTEFESMKTFKTRAMMVYTVIQLSMTAVLFWDKLFN